VGYRRDRSVVLVVWRSRQASAGDLVCWAVAAEGAAEGALGEGRDLGSSGEVVTERLKAMRLKMTEGCRYGALERAVAAGIAHGKKGCTHDRLES
jgi:hypothetical protein